MNSRKAWFDSVSRHYYQSDVFLDTYWNGYPIVKSPTDLWAYAEIVHTTKPDLIVETGTFVGGSALYLANLCDTVGHGEIVTIDIRPEGDLDIEFPDHPRIEFLPGLSSVDLRAVNHVKYRAQGKRVMVVLDSDHSKKHVLRELNTYAPLVAKDCYLIVEDTNPWAYAQLGMDECGPAEAVKTWVPQNHGFEVVKRHERWVLSQNPGGYLKRVR